MDWPANRFGDLYSLPVLADDVPDARDWVFCLGFARNGTTALARMISAHPRATLLNEVWLWGYAAVLRTPVFEFGREGQLRIENSRLLELRDTLGSGGEAWPASRVRELFEGLRRAVAPDDLVFGDKRGAYLIHLAEVLKVFPNCKLLFAARDPWDSAAIKMQADWARDEGIDDLPPHDIAHAALARSRRTLHNIERVRREWPDYEVYVARFEDFAVAPERAIRRVLAYLELDTADYDWDVLSTLHHPYSTGMWESVPELVAIRAAEEGDEQVANRSAASGGKTHGS